MILSGAYVLQHAADPFEGRWEDLAFFEWRENRWHLTFLREAPLNQELKRWCVEGILLLEEKDGEENLTILPPDSEAFLPTITERLGKLKYRFVPVAESQNPLYS